MGVAPTGNQVSISGITIDRVAEGKIGESWSNYDTMGMIQQIGAIPATPPG
jgi:predicted ester cyclase